MPTGEPCPHPQCGKMVRDWFREWYSRVEQIQIYQGNLAGDCPHCRRGVILSYDLRAAPPHMITLARSLRAGQDWLHLLNDPQYPDMRTFLASNHPAVQDYRDYIFRP